MRILYFYQYFSTSEGAWGTRVYEFTRNWVKAGHRVTVVTSVYTKSDLKSSKWVSRLNVEGIDVRVINIRVDNRQAKAKRIITFIQYALMSSWYALTLPADVVIASSGPITVGIPGLIARWLRGRKFVMEARDLWPEGAIRIGMLTHPLMIRMAYVFEKMCYKSAKAIVGLSPGIQEDIKKRFPDCHVESVTNAANIALFSKHMERPASSPRSYAVYFGNLGEVNHSNYLLDAARILLDGGRTDISIVLIGDGQLKEILKERIRRENIANVFVYDLMPKSQLVAWVQHALVSLVPLKPLPVFDTSSPNKLFESMAAGVPVIQTTQGWIKKFLEDHDAGLTVDGFDARTLAQALMFLKDNPARVAQIGANAALAARNFFDKDYLAEKMLKILKSAHEE